MADLARRESVHSDLHLLALWALAVAQPLLNLLGQTPEFFVAHHAERAEILLVVAGLVIVLPCLLIAVARLGGVYAHRIVLTLLVGALAMQILEQAGVGTAAVAVPIAVAAGVAATAAYQRLTSVRTLLSMLTIAVVAVPAIFLTKPGIMRLLDPPTGSSPEVRFTAGAAAPPPVLLLVMDEVPLVSLLDAEGKIDPVLYPNLARLARDGTWFRNATTVGDYTLFAVPAIVSGRYPRPALAPTAADYPQTLLTLLNRTHRLEVVEAITRLSPRESGDPPDGSIAARLAAIASDLVIVYQHVLFTDDLAAGLPPLTNDWANFGASDDETDPQLARRGRNKLRTVLNFAESIERSDPQPTFYYLHSLLTHSPWLWLPSGQRNATHTPFSRDDKWWWTDDEWGLVQNYQRHLLTTGLMDSLIGRIIARLETAGLYDRTLIAVTSDHGIVFRAQKHRRAFDEETAAEVMRVPLIIKFPAGSRLPAASSDVRLAGQHVDDRNVETIDIAPTIVDALGMEQTWRVDGHSLLDPAARHRPSKRMYFNAGRSFHDFAAAGPDLNPALERKLELFGGPENVYRIPRTRFMALIGQPLGQLRIEQGGGRVAVESLSSFENVDPGADAVPFDIAGRLAQRTAADGTTAVAVAVNGIVRAVTRTWSDTPRRWIATLPPDAWRKGRNQVEIYVVEGEESSPVLRRTVPFEASQPLL
jgi:hypothetical protein